MYITPYSHISFQKCTKTNVRYSLKATADNADKDKLCFEHAKVIREEFLQRS